MPPMVTYAQNFEDVMLRRALQDVKSGCYVDIGAADPRADSVTHWFYENGWRGINVEPDPAYFGKLQEARPEDVNLQCAVAGSSGTIIFGVASAGGLSTGSTERWTEMDGDGDFVTKPLLTPCITLDQLLNLVHGRDIDFMKIDAEGMEKDILSSGTFVDRRPRIIVVEATKPNSQLPNHESWESGLLEKGYLFAWFDGLNRFYVREEDKWRRLLLNTPPCYFDNFFHATINDKVNEVRREVSQVRQEAAEAAERHESVLADIVARASTAEALAETVRDQLQQARAEFDLEAAALRSDLERSREDAVDAVRRQHEAETEAASATERYEAALSDLAAKVSTAETEAVSATERYEVALSDLAAKLSMAETEAASAAERYEAALSDLAAKLSMAETEAASATERYEVALSDLAAKVSMAETEAASATERYEVALSDLAAKVSMAETDAASAAERYDVALSDLAAKASAAETELEAARNRLEELTAEFEVERNNLTSDKNDLATALGRSRQDTAEAIQRQQVLEADAAERTRHLEAELLSVQQEAESVLHREQSALAEAAEALRGQHAAEAETAEAQRKQQAAEADAAEQLRVFEIALLRIKQDAARALVREQTAEAEAAEAVRRQHAADAEAARQRQARQQDQNEIGERVEVLELALLRAKRDAIRALRREQTAEAEAAEALRRQHLAEARRDGPAGGAVRVGDSRSAPMAEWRHRGETESASNRNAANSGASTKVSALGAYWRNVRVLHDSRRALRVRYAAKDGSTTENVGSMHGDNLRGLNLGDYWRLAALQQAANRAARDRQWKEAEINYDAMMRICGRIVPILVQYGHSLKEQADVQGAEQAYREALAIEPTKADTHLQLGHALKLQGASGAALEAYSEAFRREPSYDAVKRELAGAGFSRVQLLNILLRPDNGSHPGRWAGQPDHVAGTWSLLCLRGARAAAKQKNWSVAEERYRKILAKFPAVAEVWTGLGEALEGQGRSKEAENHYLEALARNSKSADALFHLGTVFESQGDREASIWAYAEAFRLQPKLFEGREQLLDRLKTNQ